jgi:hypothetical protein
VSNVTPFPVPTPEPNTFVFGREPAAWSAVIYTAVALLAAFAFDWTPEVQGSIMAASAAILAVLQAVKVRPIQVPIIGGALVALMNLAVAFGLDLTVEEQGLFAMAFSAGLTLIFVRPQVATTATLATGGADLPRAA